MIIGTGTSLKDRIFSVLSNEWPLSARKIFHKIGEDSVTYQAVYKVLRELLDHKVIKQQDQQYFMNIEWLEQAIHHLDVLRQDYRYRQGFLNGQFVAKNPFCFDRRIANFIEKVGPKLGIKENCAVLAVCGNIYGLALKQYLEPSVQLISLHHDAKKLPKDLPENIIVVDYYIHTGNTYKRITTALRNHPKVKHILYVVEYDMLNLADIAAEKGQIQVPVQLKPN